MRPSPTDWVPSGAWLAPGYAEWAPPAALRGAVACLWVSVTPEAVGQADQASHASRADEADQAAPASPAARSGLVLPDACSDLIWEQGVGAYVAGPDTGPARPMIKAGAVIVGVRFRPSAGGQVLKTPLSAIINQRVPLADLLPRAARRLPPTLDPEEAADRVLAITGGLVVDGAPDQAMARAAALLRDPAARAEAVAAEVGLSERQFRRRSQAAAGYGPKTLQRVLRFHRFVRLLDAAVAPADAHTPAPAHAPALGSAPSARTPAPARAAAGLCAPPDLAALAAQAGYADQAHLTRECSALSGFTPAALARVRRTRQG
jgi:AraC-like DNA-binding protein